MSNHEQPTPIIEQDDIDPETSEIAEKKSKIDTRLENAGKDWKTEALTILKETIAFILEGENFSEMHQRARMARTAVEFMAGYKLYKAIEESETAQQAIQILVPGIALMKRELEQHKAEESQQKDAEAAEKLLEDGN